MKIKDLVIIGMLCAVLIAAKEALAFLPNIELASILIILYTLVFRRKTLYIIYVFVAVEGLLYGMGLWWINYLYVWTVLYFIARLFRKSRSPFTWAVISGGFGLGFGALCSIPYFLTGGIPSGVAYWVAGIPFDLIHGIANFCIALIVFIPFHYVMKNIKNNYYTQSNF